MTGASGGVGSIAVAILANLGRHVIAATGRPQHADDLRSLGAAEVIDRTELTEPGKPLGRQRWTGAIDTVGGQVLANMCASTHSDLDASLLDSLTSEVALSQALPAARDLLDGHVRGRLVVDTNR